MKDATPVKISVIRVVYSAVLPVYYRFNSLLEDVVKERISASESDKAALLEFTSCATTLKAILEEYLEQAREHSATELHLPRKEFEELLSMSKALELSQRLPIINTGIWSH